MIDNFVLALTHALMLLAAWRLIWRDDLDQERPSRPRFPGAKPQAEEPGGA